MKKFSLEDLKKECSDNEITSFKEVFEKEGIISFGQRWNCIKKIQTGKNKALIELQLNKDYIGDLEEVYLHPALLDCALSAGVHLHQRGSDTFLPVSYGKIQISKNIPERIYAFLEPIKDNKNNEFLKYDGYILDEVGNCILEVQDVYFKQIKDPDNFVLNDKTDYRYKS